jgi:predicted secreted protein
MSLSMGIFTFVNAWFLMLFFTMPFFVRPALERSKVEYAAAPQALRWKKMLITNTVVSLVVTVLLALVMYSGWIPVRDVLT